MEKYAVLKIVKVVKDRKNEGAWLFKDNKGKLCFPAKVEKGTDILSNIEIGDRYLVWVIKSGEKVDYVRLGIDGIPVRDHIDNILNNNSRFYLSFDNNDSRDIIRMANDMHNYDVNFNKFMQTGKELDPVSSGLKDVFISYDKFGINSEMAEFRFELALLDNYLYHKFNLKDIKD